MAKMAETGVRNTVAKICGNHFGKNGSSSSRQKLLELVLEKLWQKWVELTEAKNGGADFGKMG